jgi:hypothetical protein
MELLIPGATPDNDLGYLRPWLYQKQLDGIFTDKRYCVIEASTKSGKTVGCIVWLTEKAILEGAPGKHYWWVAPVSDQADIAFRRMKMALPMNKYIPKENPKRITLWNGAMIWFKSADKPDSLYGEDVYAAVVDEATRCKEDSWHGVRSTLTKTRGPIRIIGNVKGRNNWAYKLARVAESGVDNMHYTKITAVDAVEAGVLEQEEIDDARAIYPEPVFRELYLAEPSDDEGNPFGIQHIRACIGPMSSEPPVAWGWDVAKYTNYTVGIALDRDGNVCRFHRWQDSWDATLNKIISLTKRVPAFVDSTGSGDQLVERLRRDSGNNFMGYTFSTKSKQELMVGLSVAIQNREITFPKSQIVTELEAFEYEIRAQTGNVLYSSPSGVNDDCVDALAMAVKRWRSQRFYGGDVAPILIGQKSAWRM